MGQQKVKKIDIEKEIKSAMEGTDKKPVKPEEHKPARAVDIKDGKKNIKSLQDRKDVGELKDDHKKEELGIGKAKKIKDKGKGKEETDKPTKKTKKIKVKKIRSKKYQSLKKLVDRNRVYAIDEGLNLVKKMKSEGFNANIELHINLKEIKSKKQKKTKTGGKVNLPHKVKETEINYQEDKGGNLHFLIGRQDFEIDKIRENFQSILKSLPISSKQVGKMVICSTMGPGIKILYN